MNQFCKSNLATVLFVSAAVFLASNAQAAGLSPIKVQSAFGQPFAAEVEVTGLQPDDLLTAQTRLASAEEYEAAKLTFQPIVRQIRVALVQSGAGKATLKLTSSAPITEPAINVMLEFSWRGGRILQKYPVLLDPPK